jgi:hypothetical protein
MDLSSLRALVRNLNFSAHGVDATIESDPPGVFDTIATRGIWVTPDTENVPGVLELRRRERSYILAVPLLDVPHGSIVHAPASPMWADLIVPPPSPGEVLRWTVDGFDAIEPDHTRLRLVLAPLEDEET